MNGQRPDWTGKLWHIQGLKPQGPSPEAQVGRAVEWLAGRAAVAGGVLAVGAPGRKSPQWGVGFINDFEHCTMLGVGDTLEEAVFEACLRLSLVVVSTFIAGEELEPGECVRIVGGRAVRAWAGDHIPPGDNIPRLSQADIDSGRVRALPGSCVDADVRVVLPESPPAAGPAC